MKKFTFKTHKPTGKYKAFDNISIDIKYEKAVVGVIDSEIPYRVRLMVKKTGTLTDNNPNCSWLWIVLKNEFENIDTAKLWLNVNKDLIFGLYKLHKLEE
jgi:hypothetical protein